MLLSAWGCECHLTAPPAALQIGAVEQQLTEHLKDARRKLKCTSITYVALIKDTHLLEVPQASLLLLLVTPDLVQRACAARVHAPHAQ